MPEPHFLPQVIIILAAAVVSVWVFQRLRLGSMIGYLTAGAVIGPSALALVTDVKTIDALAQLGVVFLLFSIGLELPVERIRVMRSTIFGLGGAQLVLTGLVIGGVFLLQGGTAVAAVVVGSSLALSSTAVVLQILSERGTVTTRFGRTAFGVLLMQDLAVGPLLVCIPALGQEPASMAAGIGLAILKGLAALVGIVGLGRLVIRPVLFRVAATGNPEIFAALTLLIVLGAGLATWLAGLSMAFGAFLAGMLLADTRYRHQVAAEIEPFRGLLLGLFFMSVGMSIDLGLLLSEASTVLAFAVALIAAKAIVLMGLGLLFAMPLAQALSLGLLLSQAGEFAFVLVGAGMAGGALSRNEGQILDLVVAASMIATPGVAAAARRATRWLERSAAIRVEQMPGDAKALHDHVIIAGFGRIGSAVAERLVAAGQPFVAVDLDPARIAQASQKGLPVYYGDATRAEVMEALHVERARTVVIALDNRKAALQLAAMLHYIFPALNVVARAYDQAHAVELERAGARTAIPEPVAIGARLAGLIVDAGAEERADQGM